MELKLALHLREGEALRDVPAHHGVDLKRMAGTGDDPGKSEEGAHEEAAPPAWAIPVLTTVAHAGEGVEEVMAAIARHRAFLKDSGTLGTRRRARAQGRVRDVVEREFRELVGTSPQVQSILEGGVEKILAGEETPYSLGARILEVLLAEG